MLLALSSMPPLPARVLGKSSSKDTLHIHMSISYKDIKVHMHRTNTSH